MQWRNFLLFLLLFGAEESLMGRNLGVLGQSVNCEEVGNRNLHQHTVVHGAGLWSCIDSSSYFLSSPSGNRAFVSTCENTTLVEDTVACDTSGSATVFLPCVSDTPPNDTVVQDMMDTTSTVFAKYYECGPGKSWLSGFPGILVQCIDGVWTENVFDQCDDDCMVPVDCTDIAKMGFTETGLYHIYPNGISELAKEVYCFLSTNPEDSGWTLLYSRSRDTTKSNTMDVLDGFSVTPWTFHYFIGMETLRILNWQNETTRIPLVFEFMIWIGSDLEQHQAVYDNVVIDNTDPWTVLEVGTYHGNAGDAFSHSLGKEFLYTNGYFWWDTDNTTLGIHFDDYEPIWGSMRNLDLRNIVLRSRPQDFDREYYCPPKLGYELNGFFPNTWTYVSLSRAVGSTVSYRCSENELMMEGPGETMNGKTRNGTVTCQNSTTGVLEWSGIPVLPCALTCPDDFTKTTDNEACILFDPNVPEYGVTGSSYACATMKASLVHVGKLTEEDFPDGNYYLTSHVSRDSSTFTPALPSSLSCSGNQPCQADETTKCLSVAKPQDSLEGQVENCYENDAYCMCIRPAVCPDDFFPLHGFCFLLEQADVYGSIEEQKNIANALQYCHERGAGLAFPHTLPIFEEIVQAIRVKAEATYGPIPERNLFLGVYGTPEVLSPLEEDLQNLIGESVPGELYRYITLHLNDSNPYTLHHTGSISVDDMHLILCQLHQFTECFTDPEPADPDDNNALYWNSRSYGSIASYRCYPGYYIDGIVPFNVQEMECGAQMGNWVPVSPINGSCVPVDVCNDTSINSQSPPLTIVTSSNHLWLNGTMNITCPSGMGAIINISDTETVATQTLTCTEISNNLFGYEPCLEPCNVCLEAPHVVNGTTNWDPTLMYIISMNVTAECNESFLIDLENRTQELECTDVGWSPAQPCYEACVMDPPDTGSNIVRGEFISNAVGTQLYYNCTSGFHILDYPGPVEFMIVTCGTNRTWDPPEFTQVECDTVCLDDPPDVAAPGTSSWNNVDRVVGTQVDLECPDPFTFEDLTSSITLTCEADGRWTPVNTSLLTCTKKCVTNPISPPAPVTSSWNGVDRIVGHEVLLSCPKDHLFPNDNETLTVTCQEDGIWTQLDPQDAVCIKVCPEDPIDPPDQANTTWSCIRFVDTEVVLTCLDPYVFADLGPSITVTCEADGNWSYVDPDLLHCRRVTQSPPTTPSGTKFDDPGPPYWEGTVLNYTCEENKISESGVNDTFITFNGTTWVMKDPEFSCQDVCIHSPPLSELATVDYNRSLLVVGSKINYTCLGGFQDGEFVLTSVCEDDGWTLDPLPDCLMCKPPPPPTDGIQVELPDVNSWGAVASYRCAGHFPYRVTTINITCEEGNWTRDTLPQCRRTTPGPTTTEASIILSTLAPYPVDYPVTTNYYWATLQNNMSDCHGRKQNFKQTNGPFGFGYATEIDEREDQCQIHKDFSVSGDLCAKNPAECLDGFSISLWEKTTIDFDDYKALNDSTLIKKKKYFISTGGDADGHPGVAVYQEGWWLHALVSTGEKVWKVKAAGALRTDKWNNIALRWENTDNSHGLQLLVNLELKAQIQVPETKTALEPLDPPEMMIGCHKTKAMDDYGFYNTFVADELAIWTRFIDDDENRKFLGGYQENFEDVAVADFQKMLQNVNMADEDQLAAAVDVLDKMTSSEPDPADENSGGNPSPTSASASSTTKDKATASSPTASSPATTAPPMDKDFPTLLEIIQKLMDTKNVPLVISEETAKKRLRVLAPMSNVIGNPNKHNWDAIHSDKYEKGSVELILGVNKLTSKLVRSLNYTNTSIEFTMDYPNLIMQVKKTTIAELKEEGCRETPDYKTIPERAKSWNYPIDRCRVCGDLFSDPICDNRPVTVVTIVYSSLHNTMPMRYNTEVLSIWSIYELDACIQNVAIVSDVERDEFGDIDPRMPNCTIDPKLLAKRPFVCKAEHKSQPFVRATMKHLTFHENEFKSTIKRRLCVWWNTRLHEGLGGWDTQGCVSLHTQDGFTKCACKRVGLMSILAENSEAKVVPDEQLWLTVVKYIGYILSFLCLIAFIAIIAIFGDLKDMFHLMGMNLAVAQFLGSLVMLISDMGAVRDDRHACTAIGTIIQYFFFASGSWAAFLGHASFKAITAGIVGGKLRAYGFIAWGLPLVSVGLTYLLFLHDLGDDPRCFISWDNNPKYAFFGPQLFFAVLCISFGVIVLLNLSTPALRKDNLIEDYGSFCRGAAFVLLFFGLTWIFGFLAYMRFGFREPSFYPIFQVLNSWIGLMIFLFIGVGSKKFRMIVAGQAKLRRKLLLGYAFGTPNVPVEDTEQLGSPADQRKDKPRPSSPEEKLQRPLSTQSNFLAPPPSGRGMVAGRPGSTSPRPSSSGW